MRQVVLKALANQPRIFFVPYTLAVGNFAIQFVIYIIVFIISLALTKGLGGIDPLYFLISVIITHSIIGFFAKQEPQLGQIISAKIQLYKIKSPKRLIA